MSQDSTVLRMALVASSLRRSGAEKQFVYLARALRSSEIDARVFHLSQGGYYEDVLRQTQIPLYQISYPGRPFKILFKLMRALGKFKPHIVVAAQFCDISHAVLAGRFHRALTLGGIRSDGFWEAETYGWRGNTMLHLPHALVTNSNRTRANLITLGLKPEKLFLLPNVIDLEDFDARFQEPAEVPIPTDRPIAMAVGRLHPDKRFERFLEALALARRRVPDLYGVLVGKDDGCKAELAARAEDLGLLPEHLLFAGNCSNVPALLAKANFLVLPSDIEGVPNALIEGMAGRLPVITTPAGDAPHLVHHGKHGFVVDFKDTAGMAEAMVRLVNSPYLSRTLGEAGRDRIESEYEYGSLRSRALQLFYHIGERRKHERSLHAIRTLLPANVG